MLKLKLQYSETEYPLDIVTFIRGEDDYNYFLLESSAEANIQITVPYVLPLYDTYLVNDFDCYPFSSTTYFKEQNIFEVKVSDKKIGRIGWIFPIQSLSSKDHSFARNIHFLRYAFVTFYKLLLGQYFTSDFTFEAATPSDQLGITEIYESKLIVLCTSKAKTNNIVRFDIHSYIPSLYLAQYFYCEDPQNQESYIREEIDESISSLTLKEVSVLLKDEVYVISLFKNLLRKSSHPLVKFHLLYQVVEILINKIYDAEINNILRVSQNREKSTHEIRGIISDIQTEKYRVKKLIDSYLMRSPSSKKQLIDKCKQLLNLINEDSKEHVGEAFYKVRSKVVHEFRSINLRDPDNFVFTQFVEIFEQFIIELLINYNEPKEEFDSQPLEWLKYQLQNENRESA